MPYQINRINNNCENFSDFRQLLKKFLSQNKTVQYLECLKLKLLTNQLSPEQLNELLLDYFQNRWGTKIVALNIVNIFFTSGADPKILLKNYNLFEFIFKQNDFFDNKIKLLIHLIQLYNQSHQVNTEDMSKIFVQFFKYPKFLVPEIIFEFYKSGVPLDYHEAIETNLLNTVAATDYDVNSFYTLLEFCNDKHFFQAADYSKAVEIYCQKHVVQATTIEKFKNLLVNPNLVLLKQLQTEILKPEQITQLARKRLAKEHLIGFINKLPHAEKGECLEQVFNQESNLFRFFNVQRGLTATSLQKGSFKTLKAIQQQEFKDAESQRLRKGIFPADLKEQFADYLSCPISLDKMKDPAFCILDGRTYEREAITKWLDNKRTSPFTEARLRPNQNSSQVLYKNRALADIIEVYNSETDANSVNESPSENQFELQVKYPYTVL